MASVSIPRDAEVITRVTVEGRKLSYSLRVIQQPERARACGSGAKCTDLPIMPPLGTF
jgi:hypothetical protein